MRLPRALSLASLSLALVLGVQSPAGAAAVEDVATANAAGKSVFLIVTDGPGPGLEAARATAAAAQALAPATSIVELDRRDPAQAAAVAAYRVAAAPVPLVLVIASNGVATGAAKPGAEGAAQRLVALIPSPKKAEYLKHLSQQRVALVAFSRGAMPERSALFEQLSAATRALDEKAALVLVDLDDKAEARFVADLKVDPATTQPQLVVVNPKGAVLGRLAGAPTAEQIVAAASKTSCCADPNCKDCGK